ncbi:hypothetical protein [Tenacibaculum insulae]|uniref:hypothetical protein n=1 Tax=Tenacibaculum insulae TaxID=2029677 RepID=UPI003AB2225B
MNKEYIEFKKERDLGAIITDAFKFIRLEGKQFFLTILKTAAIPILIAVAAMVYYMMSMSSLMSEDVSGVVGMLSSALIMMVAYLVAFIFINLAGMHYIKSYINNKGRVNQEEIRIGVRERFWSFTGFGFLSGIIIFISVMLCVFPIFYTWTVLSLGASILVFENESATSTIGRCFSFISGHFFETFGVLFVVALLVGVLGYVFQIPALVYQLVQMGIGMNSEDPTAVFGLFSDPIYLFLNLVSIVGQFMFYSITLVTNVFLYFDINEQKNLTGTIETIDSLGE